MEVQPVILCGGFGTRLWPLSTPATPKQFISMGNESGTFLKQTLDRVNLISSTLKPILVTHEDHLSLLEGEDCTIVCEKYSNDTAVAIARACLACKDIDNTILLILPADHYIANVDNFVNDINTGLKHVTESNIVLFGIKPTSPETKYGYIRSTKEKVIFKEKPCTSTYSFRGVVEHWYLCV
jgi:mannose-1-phosphate guanylyltransferase